MSDESMVERVARAIWADQQAQGLRRGLTYDDCATSLRHQARSAIQAMREPTPQMIKAAEKLWTFEGPYHCDAAAEEVWPAMIDAALK